MAGENRRKQTRRIVVNVILLLIIIGMLYYVFHEDYREIITSVANISLPALLLLVAVGTGYQMLDAAASYTLIHSRFPGLRFRQAVELVYLSVFGNVAAFSVGVIPIQSYYLYRKGMRTGSGVGMLILRYVFHKSTIFFYAAVMLLVQNRWLRSVIPGLMKYIYLGFGICGAIALFLLLLCVSEKIQQLLLLAVGKIPDKGKWHDRKTVWTENLEAFYQESRAAVGNPACCVKTAAWNVLKLTWLYAVPFLAMKALHISGLTFWEAQALTAIMYLITGVLPHVAGIGPTELALLTLFSDCIGRAAAYSALILYRVATYFCPFLLSIGVFVKIKRDMGRDGFSVKNV